MSEEKTQVISFRVSEETYGKLKEYAEAQGESVTSVVRKVVEEFAEGGVQPAPSPEPAPGPLPVLEAPEIPAEISGLPERFRELEEKEEETRKGVEWLASQIEEIQEKVNELLGILKPTISVPPPIQWPPPPPWGFSRAGRKRGKTGRPESGENL